MEKSLFSEIGNDGLRFIRQDLHISPEGMMKMGGELIPALFQTTKDNLLIGQELGRGAACVVEQGVYSPLNIPIAIKVTPPQNSPSTSTTNKNDTRS
jgi:hypothetical protein